MVLITQGSSLIFSAQGGWGKEKNTVAAKNSVRPSKGMAEGVVWGEFRHSLAKNRGQPRRPARSEQNPAKKFSFPFRRKNRARANQKMRRKLFCGVASVSERRRGGASVSLKEGSRIFKQRAPPSYALSELPRGNPR